MCRRRGKRSFDSSWQCARICQGISFSLWIYAPLKVSILHGNALAFVNEQTSFYFWICTAENSMHTTQYQKECSIVWLTIS